MSKPGPREQCSTELNSQHIESRLHWMISEKNRIFQLASLKGIVALLESGTVMYRVTLVVWSGNQIFGGKCKVLT